jgi:hypothetical protein
MQVSPFDSIESAHEFVELLLEAVNESEQEVAADIEDADRKDLQRRKEALLLVAHKLKCLSGHLTKSRRLLNDLRLLRRLLLEERSVPAGEPLTRAARAKG